jgi:undecaprenyl-diphosphatase
VDLIEEADAVIVRIAAQFAHRSEGVDGLILHLHGLELVKGGFLLALLVWIWFSDSPERQVRRIGTLKTIAAGLAAALVSRGMQNFLPPRPRPLNAAPDFVAPFGLTPRSIEYMETWSSFPSDHAALFFAIVAGIWLLHRRLGFLTFLWTAIIICLPRIYVGLHYASDIIAGAALGVGATLVAWRLPERLFKPFCTWESRWPGPFYAAAFLFSYELVQLFSDLRKTAAQLVESIRMLGGV